MPVPVPTMLTMLIPLPSIPSSPTTMLLVLSPNITSLDGDTTAVDDEFDADTDGIPNEAASAEIALADSFTAIGDDEIIVADGRDSGASVDDAAAAGTAATAGGVDVVVISDTAGVDTDVPLNGCAYGDTGSSGAPNVLIDADNCILLP